MRNLSCLNSHTPRSLLQAIVSPGNRRQPAQAFFFFFFWKSFPSFEAERCLVNNVQEIVAHRRWMIQASRLSVQTFHLYLAELTPFWWFHRKAARAINPSTTRAPPNQQDTLVAGNVRLPLLFKRQFNLWRQHALKFNATLQHSLPVGHKLTGCFSFSKSYRQNTDYFVSKHHPSRMITPSVKIIRLDWEEGQMFNLFLAITSFAVIKSEQSVERKTLNKNLITFVFLLNTSCGCFIA